MYERNGIEDQHQRAAALERPAADVRHRRPAARDRTDHQLLFRFHRVNYQGHPPVPSAHDECRKDVARRCSYERRPKDGRKGDQWNGHGAREDHLSTFRAPDVG